MSSNQFKSAMAEIAGLTYDSRDSNYLLGRIRSIAEHLAGGAEPVPGLGGWVADDVCHWTQDAWASDTWKTTCGELYSIIDGTPEENGHKFCHHCGNPLVTHLYQDSIDEVDEPPADKGKGE